MKPPKRLRIGPHVYRIINDENGLCSDVGGARGSCYTERLTIALNGDLPHTVKAQTLLHEVVHGCLDGVSIDKDVEELVCQALGSGLLAVIRNNSKLVPYLVAD